MDIKEFQKMCSGIVSKLDEKYKVDRDGQLAFVQLVEELGELAKEVNRKKLRKAEPDNKNLSGEFADVFLQLAKLAEMNNIDLENAVTEKIKELKERGYLN